MRARILGFTLLEVLAALVIVAVGMLAVIDAVGLTARNSGFIREKTIAHWVAMNQLTQTRLSSSAPKVDKSSDEVEMADRRWRWTMDVTQTPVESVRRIDISVRLDDADENSSLATVTGFYGAAIAQPGSTIVLWQSSEDETGGEDGKQDDDGKKDDGKDNEQPPEPPAAPDPGDGGEPPPPEPSE